MLLSTVYIHKQEKLLEGEGMRWKQMEAYGSLWKTREQSIDKYISDGQSGLGSRTEVERERRNRKGKLVSGAVRDITPLLTSFRCQRSRLQQRSTHARS